MFEMLLLLLYTLPMTSSKDVACRIKLVPTKDNTETHSRGAALLSMEIQHELNTDAITVRGRQNSDAQTTRSRLDGISFYLDDSIKARDHPMLAIRIKNSKRISSHWTNLTTNIIIWNKDEVTNQFIRHKAEIHNVPYSNSTDVIFQILPDKEGVTLFINGFRIRLTDVPIMKFFGFVKQLDQLTWFKEISVCHRERLFLKMFRYDTSQPESCLEKQCNTSSNIVLGQRVMIVCSVNGIPPMSVRWYHGQTELHNSQVFQLSERKFTSKTKRLYKLSFDMSPSTEGLYTCYIENEYRKEANISGYYEAVGYLPKYVEITPHPYIITSEGNSVSVTCNVYQWPINYNTIISWRSVTEKSVKISLQSSKLLPQPHTSSVLEFTNVTLADTGLFQCGDRIATLYVERQITDVVAHTINNNGTYEMSCSSIGCPPPKLQLTLHSVLGDTIPVILVNSEETKTSIIMKWRINTTNIVYRVQYTCLATQLMSRGVIYHRATSGYGDVLQPITMTLQSIYHRVDDIIRVRTDTDTRSDTLLLGHNMTIICTARANPAPQYLILTQNDEIVKTTGLTDKGEYKATLRYGIYNATNADNGTFQCTVPSPCIKKTCKEPIKLCQRTCEETREEMIERNRTNNNTNPCPIKCIGIAPAPVQCSEECPQINRADKTLNILIYSPINVIIESPDFIGRRFIVNIRMFSHPLVICKVYSTPPPVIVYIKLDNITKAYKDNIEHTNPLTIERYIGIDNEVLITCLSYHYFRGIRYEKKGTVTVIPVTEETSSSFVNKWSGPLVVGVFGGSVFLFLLIIVIIILACINERKCRVQHRGLVLYEGDDRASKRLTSESIERASRVNDLLTQLIEQPFTDVRQSSLTEISFNSYSNSGNTSHDTSHDMSVSNNITPDIQQDLSHDEVSTRNRDLHYINVTLLDK